MGKLRELLTTEAERFRNEKAKHQKSLSEWMNLLNDLFARIDAWLKASDPEGFLEVTAETIAINDPALGEYKVPMRRVALGDKSVEIVPRARYVIASIRPPGEVPVRAHGLVEVRYLGRATHNLYQLPSGRWYIYDRNRNLREVEDNPVELLDADQFEAALASLLR